MKLPEYGFCSHVEMFEASNSLPVMETPKADVSDLGYGFPQGDLPGSLRYLNNGRKRQVSIIMLWWVGLSQQEGRQPARSSICVLSDIGK